MKPRVLVTRHVYPQTIAVLAEAASPIYRDRREVADEEELQRLVAGCEGIVSQLTDPITAEVLAAAPRLRVVAQVAVGVDNIDVAAATARSIVVTNTPGVLTESTADLTFALLLAVARRLPAAEHYLREGRWGRWDVDLLVGTDVHGRTLGLVGLGRIGRAVARRARGFGMRILYSGPRPAPAEVEAELEARHVSLEQLLARSDFVSLHVPLTDDTRGMIGISELSRMQRSAFLINTSRGAVVDEPALAAALHEGLLAGAGLDVFAEEPRVHPDLLTAPNVVLLPHIASATVATRTRMCTLAAENAVAVLRGERPPCPVNPQVLDARR
jgi:glyoxylate reductase